MMRFIVDTASTGYWPAADSADSITASAPSNTAVATSETSARVGTGLLIIDSSIWVATTTGLPARRAARVSCFWMPGTFSSGISTPRSPRATINESVKSMISASRCTAWGFSILDMTPGRQRRLEIGAVLLGHGRERDGGVGQAHALARRQPAADCHLGAGVIAIGLQRLQANLAVVEQQRVAGRQRRQDLGMRQLHAMGVAGAGIGIEYEVGARHQRHGVILEAADAQLGPLQIAQDADRPPMLGFHGADRHNELAHAVMRRMTHVDAEHVGAGLEQPVDHRPLRGGRTEGRHDLGPAQASHRP